MPGGNFALNAANADLRLSLDDCRYHFRFVSEAGAVVFDGIRHTFHPKCRYSAKILLLEHVRSDDAKITVLEDGSKVIDFVVAEGGELETQLRSLFGGRSFEKALGIATDAGLKAVVQALDEAASFIGLQPTKPTLLIRCATASKRLLGQGDVPLLGEDTAASYRERFDSIDAGMDAIRTMLTKHGMRLEALEEEMAKARVAIERHEQSLARRLSDELLLRSAQDEISQRQDEISQRQDQVEVLAGEAMATADDAQHDAMAADHKAEGALAAVSELEVSVDRRLQMIEELADATSEHVQNITEQLGVFSVSISQHLAELERQSKASQDQVEELEVEMHASAQALACKSTEQSMAAAAAGIAASAELKAEVQTLNAKFIAACAARDKEKVEAAARCEEIALLRSDLTAQQRLLEELATQADAAKAEREDANVERSSFRSQLEATQVRAAANAAALEAAKREQAAILAQKQQQQQAQEGLLRKQELHHAKILTLSDKLDQLKNANAGQTKRAAAAAKENARP